MRKVLLHHRESSIRVEVAHHDHDRVIRSILDSIVLQAVLEGQAPEVLIPPDHRPSVGMYLIGRGEKLLHGQSKGAVDASIFPFAPNHLAFNRQIFSSNPQTLESLCLQMHRKL